MNLFRARHCLRCLGYDSEQNKLSPLIELSSGYKKIKQQVAQIITDATETTGSRGTVSDEVTGEQRPDGNKGCEPRGNLGKECRRHRMQQVESGVWAGGRGMGVGGGRGQQQEGRGRKSLGPGGLCEDFGLYSERDRSHWKFLGRRTT